MHLRPPSRSEFLIFFYSYQIMFFYLNLWEFVWRHGVNSTLLTNILIFFPTKCRMINMDVIISQEVTTRCRSIALSEIWYIASANDDEIFVCQYYVFMCVKRISIAKINFQLKQLTYLYDSSTYNNDTEAEAELHTQTVWNVTNDEFLIEQLHSFMLSLLN